MFYPNSQDGLMEECMHVKKSAKPQEICKIQNIALDQSGSSYFSLKANKSHSLTMTTLQLATQNSSIVTGSWNTGTPGPLCSKALNWTDSGITAERLCTSCFEVELCSSNDGGSFSIIPHYGQMLFPWSEIFLKASFCILAVCHEDLLYLFPHLPSQKDRLDVGRLQQKVVGILIDNVGTSEGLNFCFRKISLVAVIFSASVAHSLKVKTPQV